MASYVSKAACHGRRPRHIVSEYHYRRPALVSRLLRERSVPRFLVAPTGYGKTAVALEYAETIFDFNGCFWFPCESPCFIRDLDGNVLLRNLLAIDNNPRLVVFDDIPPLDVERAVQFSQVIDTLISIGSEVIVCLSPSADVYTQLERDRVRMGSIDLLLAPAEVAFMRKKLKSIATGEGNEAVGSRVAGLAWSQSENPQRDFLVNIAREELPTDLTLAMISMMVYKSGSLSDLDTIAVFDKETFNLLESGYPHLGIDRISNRFETPAFAIEDIAYAYRTRLDAIAQRARSGDRDELACDWAHVLLAKGATARACDVARRMCAQNRRATWLIEHDERLLGRTCILPSLDVATSLGGMAHRRAQVGLVKARRLMLLDDSERAVAAAKRPAFEELMPPHIRMPALLIVARNAQGALSLRAREEIGLLLGIADNKPAEQHMLNEMKSNNQVVAFETVRTSAEMDDFEPFDRQWRPLGMVYCALEEGIVQACGTWLEVKRRKAEMQALETTASWVFEALVQRANSGEPRSTLLSRSVEPLARFAHERLSSREGNKKTLTDAIMGFSLERARSQGLLSLDEGLSPEIVLWLHDVEMSVYEQRQRYEARRREELNQQADKAATHPDSYMSLRSRTPPMQPTLTAPLLTVKLFGGLDIALGGEHIDLSAVRRNKVKVLLAILVLARGRDVSRDAIVQSLWPDSQIERARKNFYTVWSALRDMLQLPDGTCPYLIRRSGSCSIDSRLVHSDLQQFDAVCRELFFGDAARDSFSELLKRVDEEFSSDLLPAEQDNETICAARDECRARLVDALITAASNLIAVGNAQQAVWLARTALRHEDTREDAYITLMTAQMAQGQRTAAIMTFFTCKRVLADKLGLDPSPELVMLYESLLEPGQQANHA